MVYVGLGAVASALYVSSSFDDTYVITFHESHSYDFSQTLALRGVDQRTRSVCSVDTSVQPEAGECLMAQQHTNFEESEMPMNHGS